jgi:hypothetical protein
VVRQKWVLAGPILGEMNPGKAGGNFQALLGGPIWTKNDHKGWQNLTFTLYLPFSS